MRHLSHPIWRSAAGVVGPVGFLVLVLAGAAGAADAQPAKKDSSSRVRPKEATFTTSVTPSKAKPGDVVTYKVRAKLADSWHIYRQADTQPDDGPRLTTFDFFDPAGLTFEGPWKASAAAIQKQEPAFPTLPFVEYHEDEITWSRQLKVPATARAGKVTLRCQIGYMICSDQNCSFPGQWTLPPAELTITAAGASSSRLDPPRVHARLVSSRLDDPAPAARAPSKKDTRIAQPKQVKFATEFVPAHAQPGETVRLKLTAKLDAGWHIFQYAKQYNGGPKPLMVDEFDLAGLVPKGEWTSEKPPIRKKDPNFPEIEALEEFEEEASWTLPLEVPAGTASGPKSVRIQAGFQICSNTQCTVPGQWTVPTATLTIGDGGAAAPNVAAQPAPPPAPPTATATPTEATPAPASAGAVTKVGPNSSSGTTVDTKSSEVATVSDIQKTAQTGIVPFLLACAGAGLLALAMPCVWPMIPVTVNFFVKQGEKNGGKATGLAITYCLAIIGIFTGIGVLFSAFLGASSLSNLANNPWLNTAVATLFFAFGLSLLGLFEISLPSFLLNASSQGESRGGLVGVIFMATTLTITSFTCTFPVVGGLLVLAAGGSYFYPVVGLATFAAVVAFPFFLLALAPGLLAKMPRSGDWMNTVKVVGGLVELAAAFKFVNTAEIGFHSVPEAAWVDEQTLLTIWVVMALVCGIYLLGLFRTDHDQKEVKVGPGRLVIGSGFLFLGLYLAPALFGKAPEGQLYNLVVGLLPPQGTETKATSTDPEVAITQEKSKHGVLWGMSYADALATARQAGKRVLIDFTGVNCSNCRQMERTVMPRSDVAARMGEFVTVQLHTDFVPIASLTQAQREMLGERNIDLEVKLTQETTNPFYVVIDPSHDAEKVVAQVGGYVEPSRFLEFLAKGSAAPAAENKVAAHP